MFDGFICALEWAVHQVKTGIPGKAKYGEYRVKADEDFLENATPIERLALPRRALLLRSG
jgi:hypothetical protein